MHSFSVPLFWDKELFYTAETPFLLTTSYSVSSWLHLTPCPPDYILHHVLLTTSFTVSSWIHLSPCPPDYCLHLKPCPPVSVWHPVILSASDINTVPPPPCDTHTLWTLVFFWGTLCFIVFTLLLSTSNILCLYFSSYHLSASGRVRPVHTLLSYPPVSILPRPLSIQASFDPLSTFSFSSAQVHVSIFYPKLLWLPARAGNFACL